MTAAKDILDGLIEADARILDQAREEAQQNAETNVAALRLALEEAERKNQPPDGYDRAKKVVRELENAMAKFMPTVREGTWRADRDTQEIASLTFLHASSVGSGHTKRIQVMFTWVKSVKDPTSGSVTVRGGYEGGSDFQEYGKMKAEDVSRESLRDAFRKTYQALKAK
jgi:hypothetical protein